MRFRAARVPKYGVEVVVALRWLLRCGLLRGAWCPDTETACSGDTRVVLDCSSADVGGTEYNTVDAALWFLHAVDRHHAYESATRAASATARQRLGRELLDDLVSVIGHYRSGTRFGIHVDEVDGLVAQGVDGWALTWMDARIGTHRPCRHDRPVHHNTRSRLSDFQNGFGDSGDAGPACAPLTLVMYGSKMIPGKATR